MAPKGSCKGNGKATARAKMLTSVINWQLPFDWDLIKGLILVHIHGLIQINNVCSIKDEKAWDLFHDIIFLDWGTTRHFSQFQVMLSHRRSMSSPFREWWAAFRSYMGQMLDKTHNQMNNWRWDIPHAFGDQVDCSNPQTTGLGKIKLTNKRFSWHASDDLSAKIEPPICQQYKPGDILAVRPVHWDEIINQNYDDKNWADPGGPSSGRIHPGNGNDNDNGEGEEDT